MNLILLLICSLVFTVYAYANSCFRWAPIIIDDIVVVMPISDKNNINLDCNNVEIPNSIETIINDMKLRHESLVHGLPLNYDWAEYPRVNMGNNPGTFRAALAWGQVYEALDGNPATNSRIQIRDIKLYMLSKKDGQWHLLQSSRRVEGEAYREDYVGDITGISDILEELDGSISVKVGGGYNYHFWNPTRVLLEDVNDIAGMFTTVKARLILDNKLDIDDRMQARYLLNMGGDYWLDLDAQWDEWKTNNDMAIGRFKYVTPQWRSFNMSTLSEEEIRKNPPPID